MKRILGLDLGTNSIGWSLIEQDFENKQGKILGMGSRIIPMDEGIKGKFADGISVSQTAKRTEYRSVRRLRERNLLRRERLHRVLNVLGFLPEHYANNIDFEKHFGKFKDETEPKLAWRKNGKKKNGKDNFEFIFQDLFHEMLADFKHNQPELLNRKNRNNEPVKIPYDWAIYYLRKKALTEKIKKEELAWLILNFNQKRGYYQLRGEKDEEENKNQIVEFHSLKIKEVKSEIKYQLTLEDNKSYYRISEVPLYDWKDTSRDFIVTTYLEKDGTVKKGKDGKVKQSILLKEDIALLKKQTNKAVASTRKKNETVDEITLKIIDVKEEKQEKVWYTLELENGWVYRRESTTPLFDWKDKIREFIVTTDLNNDGTIKINEDGKESRSFRAPKEDDWTLRKKKTESDLDKYIGSDKKNRTVGSYIYEAFLKNPTQKIRGKLVRTIERKFYKEELTAILKKQLELQPELFTDELYNACVRELYRSNEAHQVQLSKRDFLHLFIEDIIFYQRPLRSQKSSIGNCSLEFRKYKRKDENGKEIEVKEYLKAIPKSNPYYQEFRVWQWLSNLKIYNRKDDTDATEEFLKSVEDKESLFEFLMTKKEVNHYDVLKHLLSSRIKEGFPDAKTKALENEIRKEISKYRWNYVFDDAKEKEDEKSKAYPMNETGYEIRKRLERVKNVPDNFLETIDTKEIFNKKTNENKIVSLGTREYQLWHIIYSVIDPKEYECALEKFAKKYSLYFVPKAERDDKKPDKKCFVYNFKGLVWKERDFGSFSEKAIKRLLPLMRVGQKNWDEDAIVKNSTNYFNNIQQLLEKLSKKEEAITTEQKEKWNKDINRKLYEELNRFNDADISLFQGLQLYIAQYLVYGRHSENADSKTWKSINDLETFLKEFKQHSLRNPIVEQVITETLRVVKDIWNHFGKGEENFFDEIHVELGREMKNTADDRKKLTAKILENENTNLRIKSILMEFSKDDSFKNQIDYSEQCQDEKNIFYYKKGNNPIRPYSKSQQDILKIYEDGVLSSVSERELKEIKTGVFRKDKDGKQKEVTMYDISKSAQPTSNEITKYKLWLEQKYKSPYTGEIIPLSKLFTPAYEIEHIIPQSRYFDDSLSNKVICEATVNGLKANQLGLEFIKNHFGQKVTTEGNNTATIYTVDQYKQFVEEHYANNKAKRTKLLLEDIPEKFIARQLNDTRYISKYVSRILSNIVRADEYDDGVNSKNLIPCNGQITDRLKQDWGLNDVWNTLILPRFERMHQLNAGKRSELIQEFNKRMEEKDLKSKEILENSKLTDEEKAKKIEDLEEILKKDEKEIQSLVFITKNKEGHTIPQIPFELSKGFQKKRIDHRHHAMDALMIACATRDHVNLLNNQSAKSENTRIDLQNKLRNKEKWTDRNGKEHDKFTTFKMPWENFTVDAQNKLENIVVSFKQNLRVINKATNHYQKFENGRKVEKEQKGMNWAIRKPMHEETISGIVKLSWVKLGKGEFITATRQSLDKSFTIEKIKKITDTGIQNILRNYLMQDKFQYEEKGEIKYNSELAFAPEGIEELNKTIRQYNGGKFHQPIFKVRVYEKGSGRFSLGDVGNKKDKYFQGAPNLFFVIYQRKDTKDRMFDTVPLNEVIEHQKQQVSTNVPKEKRNDIPIKKILEYKNKPVEIEYLFHLSPNDLVYVPTKEELEGNTKIDFGNLTKEQKKRLYNVNDFSDTCYFTPNSLAKAIVEKEVDMNYNEKKKKLSGSFDTKTASLEGVQIKEVCIKLKADRLGIVRTAV